RAHLVRAALEAIAYQSRDIVEVMNRDSGVELTELRVDGGASNNNFLMQFQADILGLPVVRPRLIETTAIGAAFLAGLGAGVWSDAGEVANVWQEDRRFTPTMGATQRERLYVGWQEAVERVRDDRRGPSR
ncbi:MAG: FGGY-family carbohydrate kinase, partial [Acidobacteriota bacterium]|nr:FGGY-family carbohydrate kinase [Acidobacteriota bacterium]